jgi:hypothetical protein
MAENCEENLCLLILGTRRGHTIRSAFPGMLETRHIEWTDYC